MMNEKLDNERCRLALLESILALQKVRQSNFMADMIQYESNQTFRFKLQSRRNSENATINKIMPWENNKHKQNVRYSTR